MFGKIGISVFLLVLLAFLSGYFGFLFFKMSGIEQIEVLEIISVGTAEAFLNATPEVRMPSAIGVAAIFVAMVFVVWIFVSNRTSFNRLFFHYFESSQERLETDTTDRLLEVRRLIEKEKDAETSKLLKAEAARYEQLLKKSQRSALWSTDGELTVSSSEVLAASRERLMEETDRLSARSKANLMIGMIISFLGVVFVLFTMFFLPEIADNVAVSSQLLNYLPRLTLLIVIQLIGGFFLKMYVSNENDIKQNKNEITNLELKLAGTLIVNEDRKARATVAELLVKNERNFILKRGEKVSGEAWRTEAEDLRGIVSQMIDKLPAKASTK